MEDIMSHTPVVIPSPDGTGVATTYGCTCGSNPTKGAASATSAPAWFKGHLRKMGVTVDHEALRSMFLNAPKAARTMTRTFVLRTTDRGWIKRNGGIVDSGGRVAIQVPTGAVEEFTFCGKPCLRTKLAELPRDYPNPWAVCPIMVLRKWEEATAR